MIYKKLHGLLNFRRPPLNGPGPLKGKFFFATSLKHTFTTHGLIREEYFLPKVATLTQEGQKYSHYITQLQVQPLINLSNTCPLTAI